MRVGDYVRTKDHNGFPGGIAKIKEIRNDKKHKMDWLKLDKTLDHISFLEQSTNVVKSSPNIIDLIEVGDYVNGEKVIYKQYKEYPNPLLDHYVIDTVRCSYREEEIHSIVTKEQFESMEYKVGEQ